VAIRFQRFGRKKSPFYRLVAIDSRTRRDGRPLEYLGWCVLAGHAGGWRTF
jgi:small subunit ribosomal protein S16